MRATRSQLLLVFAIGVNFIVLYFVARTQQGLDDHNTATDDEDERRSRLRLKERPSIIFPEKDRFTFVFREFENFNNLIPRAVSSISKTFPDAPVVIIADRQPYPPLQLGNHGDTVDNVLVISLSISPSESQYTSRPENFIKTEYIVILPDGIQIVSTSAIRSMIAKLKSIQNPNHASNVRAVALKLDSVKESELAICHSLNADMRRWTLTYSVSDSNTCDAVSGTHLLVMRTADFVNLGHPYSRPLLKSLYIQTTLRQWKVMLITSGVGSVATETVHTDLHDQWKHTSNQQERITNLYNNFGIKKVVEPSGEIRWFGCNRDTPRCFGTIIDDMPEYLYEGRWTPPCCMEHLRETARHVFGILESAGVRYWLEGGSLLGAARHDDIIPWDYDIDIGVYTDDVPKCEQLRGLKAGVPALDDGGYVWEKAREGDFYRVQFSASNHMHVDIFPFYVKDGIMTKDTWMETHRQDTEFPEHYLTPLTKMNFAGMQVSAPNHIREFLELKFGVGVIEHPQYPNPKQLKMPKDVS